MKLKASRQYLSGNPPQGKVAPGTGRTVYPSFRFKFFEDLKHFWACEIGRTSKQIHTKRQWED